jgi:ketosteroid isomerase-like protein
MGLMQGESDEERRKEWEKGKGRGGTEQQNIDLIKKGYEAFTAGDIDTVMNLFDDNLEWVQPGDSAISGTYHGKAELGQFISRLAEKSTTATPQRFLADGDTVVAFIDVTVGDEAGQDADLFTLRDGKVVSVRVYTDTAMMERVYGMNRLAAE